MKGRLSIVLVLAALMASGLGVVDAGHFVSGHRMWSTIPDGPHGLAPVEHHYFTASDGARISHALYKPTPLPVGGSPIILTAGPYFGLLEEPVDQPSKHRLSGFLVDNYVSHGYTVVAASVRGTGRSDGCMELYSPREVQDISELVTHLAGQPWSNGKVAMTGKSYDAGLAFAVAARGNPALATIVPIAGFADEGDLNVHRGVAEFRTAVFHPVVYWPFGFGVEPLSGVNGERPIEQRAQNANCPEMVEGSAAGVWAALTGDAKDPYFAGPFYGERNWKPGIEANYDGSIFLVHGLRDYNTNPSNVLPWIQTLSNEKKLLLGAWHHQYPDEDAWSRTDDFASMLKTWFDKYLKNLAVSTGPAVLVDNFWYGIWDGGLRAASAWPTPWTTRTYGLAAGSSGEGTLVLNGGGAFSRPVLTPAGASFPCTEEERQLSFTRPASGERLSGYATVDVHLAQAVPGNLVAYLCARSPSGDYWILTQGATNILYDEATGGIGLPNASPKTVRVEFEPAETTMPAGPGWSTVLTLALDNTAAWYSVEWYGQSLSPGVAEVTGGTLRLPIG